MVVDRHTIEQHHSGSEVTENRKLGEFSFAANRINFLRAKNHGAIENKIMLS